MSRWTARGPLRLADLHKIRRWMVANKASQPVEYHCWEAVMTLCVMGAVGWIPALILGAAWWAWPLCAVGFWTPTWYLRWRAAAHSGDRLRCDWLAVVPSLKVNA